jgi:acetolactate synthase-1/2/3 large subunit
MNGADALIQTLVENDVTACFANPGTSEMQFVSALDRERRMRAVLCLFEGVATGAADGYGRMAGVPACTLLHLGPGCGNGLANLHNARRAFTPLVNIVGDHATYHRQYDAPLSSDISAIAGSNSVWVRSAERPDDVGALAVEAIEASLVPPGGPATLILPADCAWSPSNAVGGKASAPRRKSAPDQAVEDAARRIAAARKPAVLLGSPACSERGLTAAGRLAAAGVRVLTDGFISRLPRGAGRFAPDRMMYFAEMALADLEGVDLIAFVETKSPVAFFAYPGKSSSMLPEGCVTIGLAGLEEDGPAAMESLADALGAPRQGKVQPLELPSGPPSGPLTPGAVGVSMARLLPEDAIISDDSVTAGQPIINASRTARPHDWLGLTGGAIGQGIPVAVGAAVAAPGRKVVSLNGDGAAAYTVQGLWTLAREALDVTVVIFANRIYRILAIELARTGAGPAGPSASSLLSLGDPAIDWVNLAKGFGLPAERSSTAEEFDAAFARAMAEPGPRLIEAQIA